MTATPSRADRVLVAVSVAVVAFALAARLHNLVAYPALHDFDASGHAVNVVDLHEGHLPDPRSWSGSHPPLYYALGALLWAVLPERVPVHVSLRFLSGAAWLATVWLVWRALRRLGTGVDAAVVATLLLGIPGVVIASSMMTNDALCALFVTATLVRLLEAPPDAARRAGHVALTAALASLATISKVTGAAALVMAAAFYVWQSRRSLSAVVRNLLIVGAVSAVIAVPHYARLFLLLPGPAYFIIAGRAGSQEREFIGYVVLAAMTAGNRLQSVPGFFHTAFWGDPTEAFLPRDLSRDFGLPLAALWWSGLLVVGLAVVGLVRLLAGRAVTRRAGWVLVFGVLYALALAPPSIAGPYLMLTKITYLLPVMLPLAIVLAAGLGAVRGVLGVAVRAAVLGIAAGGVALTWYGWWAPTEPAIHAPGVHGAPGSAGSAELAVRRYLAERVDDPIRAVAELAPSAQLAHDLRVVRILRLPFNEPAPASDGDRALEVARARVAWLELHHLVGWMRPMLSALDVSVIDVRQDGAEAEVATRIGAAGPVAPPGTAGMGLWPFPPFDQRFGLHRAGDTWQIASIVQSGVSPENAVQAFVANPTLAGIDDLRALGWRPDWDDATALAVGRGAGSNGP